MGYQAKKTEHAGPKRGNGAYWGPKKQAKQERNKIRRRNAQRQIREQREVAEASIEASKRSLTRGDR